MNPDQLDMANPIRNSFIINHAFRKFFMASVLISIVRMLNTLIDGIIVSQTVGPDAISAINLSTPIISLIMLVTMVLYNGGSILMVGEIGNQNYKQVDRLFIMTLSSAFVINLVLSIVLYLCTDTITHLLTDEERIISLLNDYLPFTFLGNLIFAIQITLAQLIKVSGHPGLVVKSLIVQTVSNIAFDLLFVTVFDMGMQGAALATIVSFLCSLSVFIPHLYSEYKHLKIFDLRGGWYGTLFSKSLVRGSPIAIEIVMAAVLTIGINAIVLKSQGLNGLFIYSVCLQLQTICLLISGGAGGGTMIGIGGVLMGEQDYEGVHLLVNKVFKTINVSMITLSAVIVVFPSLFARLFGAEGELLQMSEEPLRIFAFTFIPIGLIRPLSNLFMILNRNVMSAMLNIEMVVCLLSLMWLTSIFAPEYLWYSIPTGMWLLLITTAAVTWSISRRNKGLHWFYLIQTSASRHWVTYSVNYDMKDIGRKLNELFRFIERYKLPYKLHSNIHHCLEELMYNEVEMACLAQKKGTFDISVNSQDDKISVIVKDVGKPYNPIVKYIPNRIEDIDESQLSMILVDALCENVNYKYMNGVNCLYLNFKKETL